MQTSINLLEDARGDGDGPAWSRLVDVYRPLLEYWLRAQGLQPADVNDLVQDILVVMCERLPSFEHNGRTGAFRNWLRSVMINCLRAQRRDRRPATGAEEIAASLEDPGSGMSGLWQREHDRFVLCKLLELIRTEFEPTSWEAFERTVLGAQPTADAARDLGVTPNAVLLAKSRILRRLREEKARFTL